MGVAPYRLSDYLVVGIANDDAVSLVNMHEAADGIDGGDALTNVLLVIEGLAPVNLHRYLVAHVWRRWPRKPIEQRASLCAIPSAKEFSL